MCFSPRHLEDVFKKCPQDIFKKCLQDISSCLQCNNFLSFKKFWRTLQCLECCLEMLQKKKKKSKGLSDESIKPPSMYDNSQIIFVVLKHE